MKDVIIPRKLLSIILLSILALPAWPADRQYQLRVDGLACPFCAYGIEKKVKALDGVAKETVEIRLNEGVVAFAANTGRPIDEDTMKQLVNDAGFTLRHMIIQPLIEEDSRHDP